MEQRTAPAKARTWKLAAGVAALLAGAHPAFSEVIEIGGDGAVTRINAPAIYSLEGVRPIAPRGFSPAAPAAAPRAEVAQAISQAAADQAINAGLLEAVAWQESHFNHAAVSPKGAVGVMQIMPQTALRLGVDRFDLRQNISGGAAYLRQMLDRYSGDVSLGLAAYNAGPGAVDRYGGVPPFRETRAYVGAILSGLAAPSAAFSLSPSQPPLLIEP
jgi:soluble lytic murein transglycosylase-like protein